MGRGSAKSVRKLSFFTFSCDVPQKVLENSVFFPFFERHFVQSSQKKWKNSVFFARRYAKSMTKQCSFTFFKTLCTMFAENEKNQRILTFYATFHKKWEKTVFFHVFRDTLCIVSKKCEKTAFFELFARRSTKSLRKQCIFTFFETLCA